MADNYYSIPLMHMYPIQENTVILVQNLTMIVQIITVQFIQVTIPKYINEV